MNTSTYVATMMPILAANSYHSHGSMGGLGIFGTIFITIIIFGFMGMMSYMVWDMREYGKFPIFCGIFFDLIFFLIWIGIVFNLR